MSEPCPACNVAGWCWLRSIGRCDWLAEPHWVAHNAGRSAVGPTPCPAPASTPAPAPDPDEAKRLRRAGKRRGSLAQTIAPPPGGS